MSCEVGLVKFGICLLLIASSLQIAAVSLPGTFDVAAYQIEELADSQKSNQGQILPVTAQAIISGQTIDLEVARTPEEQAMGLMYRTYLADDRGMLFSFDPPRKTGFWMKNCKISLDMIFIKSGIVEAIAENVPPCVADPCPTYGPNVSVEGVIELRGGRATELDLKVGDPIVIKSIN